jgi:uncharacterized protein
VIFTALSQELSVWKLAPNAPLPTLDFFCAIRTNDELSLVTDDALVPEGVPCERGWRALKVEGPLDFALTGVLAALAIPLAEAQIPIFALSTFDTDYILVKSDRLADAIVALEQAGHTLG